MKVKNKMSFFFFFLFFFCRLVGEKIKESKLFV